MNLVIDKVLHSKNFKNKGEIDLKYFSSIGLGQWGKCKIYVEQYVLLGINCICTLTETGNKTPFQFTHMKACFVHIHESHTW